MLFFSGFSNPDLVAKNTTSHIADVALRPALNVSTVTSEMIVAKVREVAAAVTGDEALEVETPLMEAGEILETPRFVWKGFFFEIVKMVEGGVQILQVFVVCVCVFLSC